MENLLFLVNGKLHNSNLSYLFSIYLTCKFLNLRWKQDFAGLGQNSA